MAQHRSGSGDLASRQPSQTHLPRLSTDESASEHSGAELVADVDGLSLVSERAPSGMAASFKWVQQVQYHTPDAH